MFKNIFKKKKSEIEEEEIREEEFKEEVINTPVQDMYEVFKAFRNAMENDYLKEVIEDYNVHNFTLSYNKDSNAIRMSMDEGDVTIKFWNGKDRREDYIYYREPDAPDGAGLGMLAGVIYDDGHIYKPTEDIDGTVIDVDKGKYGEMFDELVSAIKFVRISHMTPLLSKEERKVWEKDKKGFFTKEDAAKCSEMYAAYQEAMEM